MCLLSANEPVSELLIGSGFASKIPLSSKSHSLCSFYISLSVCVYLYIYISLLSISISLFSLYLYLSSLYILPVSDS